MFRIKLNTKSGGALVLAEPGAAEALARIKELLDEGHDGITVLSPENRPIQIEEIEALAARS